MSTTPLQPPDDALIRLDEVLKRIPVSRSTFFAGQPKGLYPAPISIGPRARAYRYKDVREWLADPEKWQREHSERTVDRSEMDQTRKNLR